MRPFPIFLVFLATAIRSEDQEDDFRNPIQMESQHMDYDTKTIILRESKRLLITCTYASDDIGDISDLQWKKEGGKNIDESSSPSVFTVGLRTYKSGYRKRNLHFTAVHKRDAGNYICYGKNMDGTTFQNTVKVVVLDAIAWNDPSTEAGALVGEPLTIDCAVKSKGSVEPHIEITSGNGEALNPDMYTIAGNEVTIQELTQAFDGQKISCVHVELVTRGEEEDFPLVDRKDVDIVVWHKPEFDEDVKEQYTIVSDKDRHNSAVIYCNVTASNPPATHFVFYRGNNDLSDPLKYELTKHVGKHQGAELKINNLNLDDLDEYRCEVNNGKAKASQIIHLKEAKKRRRPTGFWGPPPEPKVTLDKVKKHSLMWKVESPEKEGDLPIVDVQIQYIRKAVLDDKEMDSDEDEVREDVWDRHAISIHRPKTGDNMYEITGLRQGSEYKFKFRQISQAGAGEAVHLSAFTADDAVPVEEQNSSPLSILFSSLIMLILSWLC